MATLVLNMSVSQNAEKIYIDDNTSVWGTPDRNSIALVAMSFYKDPNNQVVVYKGNYNPAHANNYVSNFEFDYTSDGWYEFALVAVLTNPPSTEGNIRYNISTQELEIYQGTSWVKLEDFDLLFTETALYEKMDYLLHSKNAIKTACLWKDISENKCRDMKCATDTYWFTRGQLYAALNQFMMGNKHEAHRMLDNLNRTLDRL